MTLKVIIMYMVGHLAKVDTIAELTALRDLFVNDNDLSVGLRYVGERGWRWVSE